jgi:hypothetical protein
MHILRFFTYHILYRIRVFTLESDILIRQFFINQMHILKNGFGDGFDTEIILSFYILPANLQRVGAGGCRSGHRDFVMENAYYQLGTASSASRCSRPRHGHRRHAPCFTRRRRAAEVVPQT